MIRMRTFWMLGAALAAGGLWAQAPAGEAILSRDGAPSAAIVLGSPATRSARLAAKELQFHLQTITGAAPEIVAEAAGVPAGFVAIHVGDSAAAAAAGLRGADLKPQEQVIRITPAAIWLIGLDEADFGEIAYEQSGAWPGLDIHSPTFEVGTLYAVYDFLERECGVRWYMPGEVGTVAPRQPTLRVPAGERRVKPWTTCRLIGSGSWGKPGTFGKPDIMGYVRPSAWGNGRDGVLHLLRSRARGTDFGFNAHPFHNYVALYGKTHPEYFVDSSPAPSVQLRYGKPEVVAEVTRNVLDYFAGNTAVKDPVESIRFSGGRGKLFLLGPSDTRIFGTDAQPPLQQERRRPDSFSDGRASNYWFTFVNEVARRVREKYPDRWIGSSAYASHFEPPEFPLEPNVGVYVCGTEGWEADSYGVENLRAWKTRASRVFTYEYWYSGGGLPAVRPHRLAAYIELIREIGLEGWNMEMISGANPAVYHLDYYLNMRLLYDPDADVEAMLAEYYDSFYGPAAVPMRRFWETIEQTADKYRTGPLKTLNRIAVWAAAAEEGFPRQLEASLVEAEKLATSEPYAERLRIVRGGVYDMVRSRIDDALVQANTPIPTLAVRRGPVAVTLDGKLDDPAWQQAPTTTPFVHMDTVKPTTDDVGKVLWDGENLYVGMVLIEPDMAGQALVHKTSTSGICVDDSVEVFVDVGRREPGKREYVQVMLTAAGVTWRYYWGKQKVFAQDMPELGIEAVAWRGDDRWTAELKIPLKPMVELTENGAMPNPGDRWGLGLYRNRRTAFKANVTDRFAKGSTGWSPTFGGFHVANRFGYLAFAE